MNGRNKRAAELRWDRQQARRIAAARELLPPRKRGQLPGVFAECCDLVRSKDITERQAARICGWDQTTYRYHARRHGGAGNER